VVYFLTYLSAKYSDQITDPKTGQTIDYWTISVTSFTAVMLIISCNLLIRSRYISNIHIIFTLAASLLIYFIYMWFGNFFAFS